MAEDGDMQEVASAFLLAEFTALQDRALAKQGEIANRINFFLVTVAAIIAGISVILEGKYFQLPVNYGLLIASITIFVLGIATLDQIVKYSAESVFFYRVAGRVRKYFVDSCHEISSYVAFYPTDSHPRLDIGRSYIALRGGDAVLLAVNALAAGVIIGAIFDLLLKSSSYFVYGTIMVLAFVVSWWLQVEYVRYLLRNAEKIFAERIHFPESKNLDFSSNEEKDHSTIGENDLLIMSEDPEIQHEMNKIEEEFAGTETDELEARE